MDKLRWIKDLVLAEQEMEETGVVDISAGFDPEENLKKETIEYLKELKVAFVEAASAFNQLKGSNLGNIKIYGISKTAADFMLFRNGFKMIFSMRQPGSVTIRFNHIGTNFIPGSPAAEPETSDEHSLKAIWGAFGDLSWQFQGKLIKIDYLVRYYMSRFVKESAK